MWPFCLQEFVLTYTCALLKNKRGVQGVYFGVAYLSKRLEAKSSVGVWFNKSGYLHMMEYYGEQEKYQRYVISNKAMKSKVYNVLFL